SANDGYQYRATATNSAGDATSQIAKLTVTPKAGTDTELAFTGSEATPAFLIAALVALLLGAGLVTANRVAKRRVNRSSPCSASFAAHVGEGGRAISRLTSRLP